MPEFIRKLVRKSEGATAIEYGLIAALIAVGAISGFNAFGNGLSNMWGKVENNVKASS
ncbi:Flp family type IVb pilin [Sphingosinicella microcystinivorans]|uniref:Flp family type IVb pilin n=1 Tax=Sphingosinicella microcystinivorans TaxID=335406 RepID=UPI0022F37FB0|nr:Flp family type IVb pilin [Sphingosinicella microcystinivorans]WBX85090.1 Flp family type IVb pilin [Sphingosinicella microcystinivorans]